MPSSFSTLSFSEYGRFAIFPAAGSFGLYDISLQEAYLSLSHSPHSREIISSTFASDNYIITSSLDNTVSVWETNSMNIIYTHVSMDSANYLNIASGRYDGTKAAKKLLSQNVH